MLELWNGLVSFISSSSIVRDVIAIVTASSITGIFVYYVRKKQEYGHYLPDAPSPDKKENYDFINGDWYLYHYTVDSKRKDIPILATSTLNFSFESNFIVVGTEEVQVDHRRSLKYLIRGQIRAGQFMFTAICIQDSSEIYTGMFPNLLDDEAGGMILAKDYQRNLYSSAALITKEKLSKSRAKKKLEGIDANLYK